MNNAEKEQFKEQILQELQLNRINSQIDMILTGQTELKVGQTEARQALYEVHRELAHHSEMLDALNRGQQETHNLLRQILELTNSGD